MKDEPLYNSRVISSYTEYLKENHPDIDISSLLEESNINSYEVEDEGHWFTQKQVDEFYNALIRKIPNPALAREAGRFMVSSVFSQNLGQFVAGFFSPANTYLFADKLSRHLDRSAVYKTKKIGSNKVEILTKPKPNVEQKPYQCENRLGIFESLGKFFLKKYPRVDHPECIHRGDDLCRYIIIWDNSPHIIWQRFLKYVFVLFPIICLTLYFLLPYFLWGSISAVLAMIMLYMAFYGQYLEKKELSQQLETRTDTADRLLEQINTRYNNALLIQEIGQATSMTASTEKVFAAILEAFEKYLDFDRGMIMLANKEKTRLVYTAGYGYKQEQKEFVENISFNLGNPNSKGAAVLTFKRQKPFLINSIAEIARDSSQKSMDFAEQMEIQSFICVPIVFEKESLGVLFFDNIHSKRRFDQSDVSLLMGIAPQIAINIYNAVSYQKIRESEEKFRSLSENTPDIIYTLNVNGLFTYVNPAWEKLLGYRAEDVIGAPFENFVRHPENDLASAGIIQKLKSNREIIQNTVVTLFKKDSSECYFSMSAAPNLDTGDRVTGFVGTLKDITALKQSEEQLKRSYDKLQGAMKAIINSLSEISAVRDAYTANHQAHVAKLARAIAEEMRLSEDQIEGLFVSAVVHDLGKINIPSEILSTPRKLTPVEFELIKTHPAAGYNILKHIEFPWRVAEIILQHHERINGSGYPQGLKGNEIAMESKILSVADVVEAMTSHRPYRPALGLQKAMEEISQFKGTLYDEQVADACLKLFEEKKFSFNS